jgi:hypothetical protein
MVLRPVGCGFMPFVMQTAPKANATDETQTIFSDVLQYGRDVDGPMEILLKKFATPFRKHVLAY